MKPTHSSSSLWAIPIAAIALLASLEAAPITWSSRLYPVSGGWGQYLDTGVFLKTGNLFRAENVGGSAVSFDGIDFAAGSTVFSGTYTGFHDGSGTLLSRAGTYGGSTPNTVTLGGLTPGNSYRVQALVYDGRGDGGIVGRRVSFDGIDQGQYANGVQNVTWGPGLLVTGTFIADATTQSFTVETFYGSSSKGGQLNALLVHEFVNGVPSLDNPAVASITGNSAQAGADLGTTDAELTLHWDTTDQDKGTWGNSLALGAQVKGPVSANLTGLLPDTRYFYRFRAVNTAAEPDTEAWSAAGTSFATAPTGKAPGQALATTVSKTEIDVEWSDTFDTESGFIVERRVKDTIDWSEAGRVAPGVGYFMDRDLLPGTTYVYRVMAYNDAGLSDASTEVQATTLAPDPGIVVQAWYRMGDAGQRESNRPLDSSGNGRDFTDLTAAATANPSGGGYGSDAYVSLNGIDQSYYGTGYDAPENNVGVEVWVRTSDLAQANRHVFGTGSNTEGLNMGWESRDGIGWFGAVANVAGVGSSGAASYTAGQWVHLALVREQGLTTFYVNGVASGTSTAVPRNATSPHLGKNYNFAADAYFSGDVAEARIFTFDAGQFNPSMLLYPAPAPADPYAAWLAGFPGLSNAGAAVDFDGGGIANGIEWVTGGDPTQAADDASHAPVLAAGSDPSTVRFSFRRRDAATGVVVEYGSDLAGWRDTATHGATDGVVIADGADLGGGFHQVDVTIPRSLATGGRLFARLKVVRP